MSDSAEMIKSKSVSSAPKNGKRPLWLKLLLILGATAAVVLLARLWTETLGKPANVDTAEVTMTISPETADRLIEEDPSYADLELDLLGTGLKEEFTRPGSKRSSDERNGGVKARFYYLIQDDLVAAYGYNAKDIKASYIESTLITGKKLGDDRQTIVITVETDNENEIELVERMARSAADQLGVLFFGAPANEDQAAVTVEPVDNGKKASWRVTFRLTDEAAAGLSRTKYYATELDLNKVAAEASSSEVLQKTLTRAGSDAKPADLRGRFSAGNNLGVLTFRVTWPTGQSVTAAQLASAAAREAAAALLDREPAEGEVTISSPVMLQTDAPETNNGPFIIIVAGLLALIVSFILFSGQPVFESLVVIFFVLFTFICVFPFYYLFINTISDNNEVARGTVNFLPTGIHLTNYDRILGISESTSSSADILNALLVTVGRTILGTALMVLTSAWAGYLVTKQKMWHRSFWYRALVITMYFNAGLIPWYTNMLMLGLTGNFLAYIIPGMVAPYNIILVKTYIESIPASLEESAIIDGASTTKVFLRIILPLSIPILATIAIFGAVGNWNSFQDSLLLMSSNPKLYTLQHRLYIYLNQTTAINTEQISEQTAQNLLNNGVTTKYTIAMITIIPILLVYPFMQRYFVKGIMLGAVKG